MSRRTKLLLTALFVALLSVPAWNIATNWAPANPLRFRLISRESMPPADNQQRELLEIEVRNTSTAPRVLHAAICTYAQRKYDPFHPDRDLVDPFVPSPVIPPGGTWRGSVITLWNLDEPGGTTDPIHIRYTHTSIARRWMLQRYNSICQHLPHHVYERIALFVLIESETQLEIAGER